MNAAGVTFESLHRSATVCSCPSPGTVRIMKVFPNTILQKWFPGGVWRPRLRKQSVKNVRGRRPTRFFTFILHNLGPRTPPGHNARTFLYLLTGPLGGVDFCNSAEPSRSAKVSDRCRNTLKSAQNRSENRCVPICGCRSGCFGVWVGPALGPNPAQIADSRPDP